MGCQLSIGAEPLLDVNFRAGWNHFGVSGGSHAHCVCERERGREREREGERGGTTLAPAAGATPIVCVCVRERESEREREGDHFGVSTFEKNNFGVSTLDKGGTTLASAAGATPIFSEKSIPISARTCTGVPRP